MSRWHQQNDEIFELTIRDSSGRKIDTFKGTMTNFQNVMNIVIGKYGVGKKTDDLDWLKDF